MDPMITTYLDYARLAGLAETTRYNRARTLARLEASLPVPLIEATPDMLAGWRASLRGCNQSVANYVTDVRMFFGWAEGVRGLRPDNPAAALPVPRRARRLPRPIETPDLVEAILSAPERIRAWLVLAAFCGLRACEIAYLRRECIFEHGPMLLVAADATKGCDERMIPLIPLVLRELGPLPAAGWMFPRRDGTAGPNTPHTVSRIANRHLKAWNVTLHQLRHFFGTLVYDESEDVLLLAELMGHRCLDSSRIYAKIRSSKKTRVMAALPVPEQLLAAA